MTMPMFLFRNSDATIEFAVTDTKAGTRLPHLPGGARWLFQAELKNSTQAAIYGLMNYDQAKAAVARKGYAEYIGFRLPKALEEAIAP